MARSFAAVLKDQPTESTIHVDGEIGQGAKPARRVRTFREVIAGLSLHRADMPDSENVTTTKRDLQPHAGKTMKAPFPYDPNFLGSLRPDQVPRFYGALTDPDKLDDATVKIADLHATQDRVDGGKVAALRGGKAAGKKPIVVKHGGKLYVADGHHRLAADWLDGKETADVKMKDIEPVSNAMKSGDDGKGILAKIIKLDPDKHLVYGWASVIEEGGNPVVDHQGDVISSDDLVSAAHGFMSDHRNPGLIHLDFGKQYGSTVESMVFTKELQAALGINLGKVGWLICHKVTDPNLWADVKSGKFPAFSIGGSGKRVEFKL